MEMESHSATTCDEFQHALGDPVAHMNMGEYLEESQAMAAAINPLMDASNGCLASQIPLQKQGSLCLPRAVSMRMVEEAWKILRVQQETWASASAGGDITMDDLMCGRELPPYNPSPPSFQGNGGFPGHGLLSVAQQGDCMITPYNKAFSQQQQHGTEQILKGSPMVDAATSYSNTSLSPESSADTSNLVLVQPAGRKRCAEAPLEQVIEGRQRRMIKNRESAARSRARKQAYTMELEYEAHQLKEENIKLVREQEEESELRKKQMLAVMRLQAGCALQRTHSGPW